MDYADYSVHRLMVRDEVRTSAFQRAIAGLVKPGAVVLDVGAGSGVLSLFAAQAGARRVHAVERSSEAAAMARHLAQVNGFGHVIHVIEGDIRAVAPIESVDVIVSEWMGTIGIDENMYGAVLWARDHWLKPGGLMIPAAVTAFAAPVALAQRVDAAFFAERPWGLDLAALGEPLVNELLMVRRRVESHDCAAPPAPLWTHVALSDPPETVRHPARSQLSFAIAAPAQACAFAMWFVADLGDDITLSNAPDAPDTHWGQMILPLTSRLILAKGDTLHGEVAVWPVGPGPLMFAWQWQVNDGPAIQLDTTGRQHRDPAGEAAAAPPVRSSLSQYLAALAIDAERLAEFLADPDGAMATARLTPAQIAAVKSQNSDCIGMALFDVGAPP